jgi:hypothetical protein
MEILSLNRRIPRKLIFKLIYYLTLLIWKSYSFLNINIVVIKIKIPQKI